MLFAIYSFQVVTSPIRYRSVSQQRNGLLRKIHWKHTLFLFPTKIKGSFEIPVNIFKNSCSVIFYCQG